MSSVSQKVDEDDGFGQAALRLRVPSTPTFAPIVRERVATFARSTGIDPDGLADFLTAVGEAIANAFEHARSEQTIEVTCWIAAAGDRLLARVVDGGIGFPVDETLGAAEPPPLLAERGRGFTLMRRCSDIFAVRSAPGAGTEVMLGRSLRRPHGSGPPHLRRG